MALVKDPEWLVEREMDLSQTQWVVEAEVGDYRRRDVVDPPKVQFVSHRAVSTALASPGDWSPRVIMTPRRVATVQVAHFLRKGRPYHVMELFDDQEERIWQILYQGETLPPKMGSLGYARHVPDGGVNYFGLTD